MRAVPSAFVLAFALLASSGWSIAADVRDRANVPEQLKWNLTDLYPNTAAWRAAKEKVAAEVPSLRAFQGKLASSAAVLADALELRSRIAKELVRVSSYAQMLRDQDTRVSEPEGMVQEVQQLSAALAATTSYAQPEILTAGEAAIERFIASEPRLKVYSFYLRDVLRRAPHTLSDTEEKILADALPTAAAASNVFGILSNADFPYPSVTLSDGRSVKLNTAGYFEFRSLPNRADREKVMSAYFTSVGGFNRTFGTTMNGNVQSALFFSKSRKYPGTLEASLNTNNIPVAVYMRLLEGVNRSLPAFHRYLKLRKRLLGVEQLHYYDLYAPLVGSVKLTYTPEEAQQMVLRSFTALGDDYVSTVARAFRDRWVDLMPSDGKRSGAYSNGGAYDVHPYILMNYLGKFNDVGTLAHELGHTMHSYYSNKTQPYALASYPIFVAEVASTFNEALLEDHMLGQVKDDAVRLSLLGDSLENIKSTLFRQTQFAEFELRMHERAQKGLPLTGEALSKLYLEITRRYYGHDAGVCVVDDYVAHEWSTIPHFYRPFYVFQYATSLTGSMALAEKVLAGDEAAKKRYLNFLAAGGSKYPIELLRDAGVDMTSDEPLDLTVRKMNRIMDEMEVLLAKMPRATNQAGGSIR